MIVLSVIVICAHKAWRFYLRDVAGLDPVADYWRYETLSTLTRAIGALVAVPACWWGLADARRHFGPGALRPALVMALGIPAYLLLRTVFSGPPEFEAVRFERELLFNSCTGFFEEFAFRGLLFAGMYRFLGAWKAVLASAMIFAIWHFDVSVRFDHLLFLVVTGVFYALAMQAGASLLVMSLAHFAWDQAVYGLRWQDPGGAFVYTLVVLELVLIAALPRAAVAESKADQA
jgi:membrane protease YdiL (CAAX protease family)